MPNVLLSTRATVRHYHPKEVNYQRRNYTVFGNISTAGNHILKFYRLDFNNSIRNLHFTSLLPMFLKACIIKILKFSLNRHHS